MTQTEIICIYFLGSVLCLWLQIYHERKYERGMSLQRFMGAVALAALSYASLLGFLIFLFGEYIENHGTNMIFTDYDTVNKERAEQRAKQKKWDK